MTECSIFVLHHFHPQFLSISCHVVSSHCKKVLVQYCIRNYIWLITYLFITTVTPWNFISEKSFSSEGVIIHTINSPIISSGTEANNTLSSGHHSFPFTFKLPSPLPSSLEGKHGYVRYFVMAEVKRPGIAMSKSARVTFSVNNVINLNHLPVAKVS